MQHIPVEVVYGKQQVDAAAHGQHDAAAHREAHLKGVQRGPLAKERRARGVRRGHVPDALPWVVGGAQDQQQEVEVAATEDSEARLVHAEAGEKGARPPGELGATGRVGVGVHDGVQLPRELCELGEKGGVLGAVAVVPVIVAGQVGGALGERREHVEQVHGARGRRGVLASGVGEGRRLAAEGEQLGAQRLVDAALGGVGEVAREAAHAVVQARAGLAGPVADGAGHEQACAQRDAAGGEDGRLRREAVHEVDRPQLQKRKEHGVGEVAARVELRRAHEHQRKRHRQVHGHAEREAAHGDARPCERERAHQEEAQVLRRWVVLFETSLKERGEGRDREEVLVPKAQLHDPEQHDEKHNDRQRTHELGTSLAQPPPDLLAHPPSAKRDVFILAALLGQVAAVARAQTCPKRAAAISTSPNYRTNMMMVRTVTATIVNQVSAFQTRPLA